MEKVKKETTARSAEDMTVLQDYIKIELEGLITQWSRFGEYFQSLDTGHDQVFTISFAALGLFSIFARDMNISVVFWVLPLAIMVLFYYEAYRLRRVAILKGYLAQIDCAINKRIKFLRDTMPDKELTSILKGLDVFSRGTFSWYYAWEEVFITNNNRANKYLGVPVFIAFCVVSFFNYTEAATSLSGSSTLILFNIYFGFILFMDVLAFVSIMKNLEMFHRSLNADIFTLIHNYRDTHEV